MPPLSAAPTLAFQRVSISLTDFRGRSRAVAVEAGADVTLGERDAMALEVGNMSNARVMRHSFTTGIEQLNPGNPLNTAFDEAYPVVDDALVLVFQNNAGTIQTVPIPAPDAQFFLPDGETVIAPTAAGSAAQQQLLDTINAIEDVLNADTVPGTYNYARGYKEGVRRRTRTPLPITEPTGLQEPSALPG